MEIVKNCPTYVGVITLFTACYAAIGLYEARNVNLTLVNITMQRMALDVEAIAEVAGEGLAGGASP